MQNSEVLLKNSTESWFLLEKHQFRCL